ncbi:DNA repair protein RecO [Pleurostoma richardsiae]|uniref:DNA repair protein RecO n=1 Tax=Pleurostoma richardsiae TaxID=41990 RepID=A0AA38R7X1_9PEZI|nr:DNA repair protein RecO [Pleurostoma richardsiae]
MVSALEPTDAKNKLEDLSGVTIQPGQNPYDALVLACNNDPAGIQSLYSTHRVTRNAQQKQKFLSDDFNEVLIDPFLLRIEQPNIEPGFKDHRNCLVFWARPPEHVLQLAARLQSMLKKAAPNLWLMPLHRMHMTTLEIDHSRTPFEIASLVSQMRSTVPTLTNFTFSNRSRLVKPMLSYDLAAIAMSFLPAAGEPVVSPPPVPLPQSRDEPTPGHQVNDGYTYHHLRRDVFTLAETTGVNIASRYVVPSAHITLGRYLTQDDHATPEARRRWVETIDEINAWLEREIWNKPGAELVGEWIVGQEKGLEARNGALWYGGGRTIMVGEGF